MTELPIEFFRELAVHFQLYGTPRDVKRNGSGHINDTYAVTFDQAGAHPRYIFQRVNHNIFKNVPQLMDNVGRVTRHLANGDSRRALTLIPSRDGKPYHQTPEGDFWRVYLFIEGARTYDRVATTRQAFEAARAFGRFQKALANLPGGRLFETIPRFHDTPSRLAALKQAAEADTAGRRKEVGAELGFVLEREEDASRLVDLARAGDLPERVTHNDTKLNNVMLDERTEEGICVIDLDTVMPGMAVCDFGEIVRFSANTSVEDEVDHSRIGISLNVYAAIVEGYVAGAGEMLTRAEWDNLVSAARLMTYENGVRFLTDYLQGDTYFKIKHPRHNLIRARCQLLLTEKIETASDAMESIVRQHRPRNI